MSDLAISTDGLSKRFGSAEALVDLDLEVRAGETFGYLGPNGAGKTTTIRILLGLARPTSGSAEIFGLDCHRDASRVHQRVASVPGDVSLWPSLTGAETLALLGQVQGGVDEKLRDELIERFELDPSRKIRALSRGNRQKVILIAALMSRADLMIFDEPTAGLDPLMEQEFRACVRELGQRGQTVFLSSHILSEVEALCGRVAILRAGRLVEVGVLAEMRHLAALSVEAVVSQPIPDLRAVQGVSAVEVEGTTLRCQVRGSMAPLLAVLEPLEVTSLLSREPSLEELFLSLYGAEPTAP
jgi:ABC-2 type transport system ATP-binding protein